MRIMADGLDPGSRVPWQRSRLCRIEYGMLISARWALAPERHNPLDLFAEAWSRFLLWLGWRR
jgi:hypothetical protein